jgi:ZIP family zinc transporter
LPEGFNAYREMIGSPKISRRSIFFVFIIAALVGPLAAFAGLVFLAEHKALLGGITLFASGSILYLVFQDVAPQAKLERHWGPALGAATVIHGATK